MLAYSAPTDRRHKVAYLVTSALPYAMLFLRAATTSPASRPPPRCGLRRVLLLASGAFFFDATICMIGFWFLEVTRAYVVNS